MEVINVIGIDFYEVGPPCTTADIRQFEDWFGHTLPPPLRRLLATFNGAFPASRVSYGLGDDELWISTFLQLEGGGQSMRGQVELIRRVYPEVPHRFIPFAYCGGDPYLIDTTDPTAQVYGFFPDTGHLEPEPSGLTLEDFLEGIRKADRLRKAEG